MLPKKRLFVVALALATSGVFAAPPRQPTVMMVKPASRPEVTYAYSVIKGGSAKVSVKAFASAMQITAVPAHIACDGVAITGGFSRQSGNELKPQGLVRTADGTLSKLANWRDGGVLSLVGADVRVTRIADWRAAPSSASMALQARPILVADGKVDEPLNDRSHWNRVAVGTMRDGSTVFIGAFTPHNNAVTLREFAQDAIAIIGPNLVSLLNLDGGPSAFLYSRDMRLFPSQGAVTTYLCAEER